MSNKTWTIENIPDLSGKVIIVTGGNSGLGYESVKAFARKGAEVILACRNTDKGHTAKAEIGQTKGNIQVMELDLMDFASIKAFSDTFKKRYKKLDVLLNNAGIMTTPYFLTKDGLEAQNGTNHFGHFALTAHLSDTLKDSSGSRVVNVSSLAHKNGNMDFDNLLFEEGKDYSPLKSYGRSKLANLLFTYELQRQFEANNVNSIAVAAHPGASQTNLARHLEKKWWFMFVRPLFMLMTQSQERGALPQIRASVDPAVKGADYYGPGGMGEMRGDPVKVKSTDAARSQEDAATLWKVSEELTHTQFQF
ncbi:MAG: oxidoreductase [Bacteroidota bacterium]